MPCINKGGTILIVGVFGDIPPVDLARVGEHELNIKGSMMYWIEARKLLEQGIILDALLDGVYSLDNWGLLH